MITINSLKHILQQRIPSIDQQCSQAKLLGLDFEAINKPGKEDGAVNALFKVEDENLLPLNSFKPLWYDIIQVTRKVQEDS